MSFNNDFVSKFTILSLLKIYRNLPVLIFSSTKLCHILIWCYMQAYLSGNYISAVISSPNYTSLPFMAAIFLVTCLMAVLQSSRYFIFHGGDIPIQLGLSWWNYSCQCLNTKISTRGNRGFITKTPNIFYTIHLYIRLCI